MISIDVKASQPYLLTVLLNPNNWKPGGLISIVSPELYSKISKVKYQKLLSTILMFGTFPKRAVGKGFHKTGFHFFSWDTDFYQNIVNKAKADGEEMLFPNRNTVKQRMMMILFDDGVYMEKDKGFLLFKKWYPEEASLILLIKQISRDAKVKNAEDSGLNFLPITLQRIESYLMLEKVCKQISKILPDAPIIPVHDCIMTTEKYAKQVADITKNVLQNETGLIPGITEELNNPNLLKTDITELAANDIAEILDKKPKGKYVKVKLKRPLLASPPDIEGDWLVHSRYHQEGDLNDSSERMFHIINDLN
jgi:hypothetical protein